MQVEKDIVAAIDIINKRRVDTKQYRSVKLFPSYSLKFFKKYKLDGRKVLTKCNSISEVLDLVSYNACVTCYSSNRLDEYFLNLQLALLNLKYNEYMNYLFNKKRGFSKQSYNKIKDELDSKTRYFFDEMYKTENNINLFQTKLCDLSSYDYETLKRFIRYFLESKYYKTSENSKIHTPEFILCKDISVPLYFEDNSFSFINLSYNIDNIDNERIKYIEQKIRKDFISLLCEFGKIQLFAGTKELDLEGFKKFDTRSITDPNSQNGVCKKDYAYVYSKQ